MTSDLTEYQSDDDRQKSQALSVAPTRPPAVLPGYRLDSFLGQGAYGEVWSAVELKTGKKVAIKFYTQQSADDVQQLAQEVEKLLALSTDRYVVQLLDVGWEGSPPYYVMDFLEHGSLESRLQRDGRIDPELAVEIFKELAQGLMHLHGKGILHCDLKPANVLLDQDSKPRVADFGQARLSTEKTGALGTLYYMAPEQADLDAVPDARWDVYGLGAMMFCMLTGHPPFRDSKLTEKIQSSPRIGKRLEAYRSALASAETPKQHRSVEGVDRALADIIDRCLSVDPAKRFHSVQSVIEALAQRETRRTKRPLMLLGILGPLLLLGLMSFFGGWAFERATRDATRAVIEKANESNIFKARLAARSAAERIEEYFRAAEQLSHDDRFLSDFETFISDPSLAIDRKLIADPNKNTVYSGGQRVESDQRCQRAREKLMQSSPRRSLERYLRKRMENVDQEFPQASSWFISDRWGNQVASAFKGENRTELNNYSYRTYFSGLDTDLLDEKGRYLVPPDSTRRQVITMPHLSAIFLSQANNKWKVAFSTPIRIDGKIEGIVAVTVVLGDFIDFDNDPNQYVMMVDGRTGDFTGTILEHPLLDQLEAASGVIPKAFSQKRVSFDQALSSVTGDHFEDPMGDEPEGVGYRRPTIAASAPVVLKRKPVSTQMDTVIQPATGDQEIVSVVTGLEVVAVEDFQSVIDPVNSLSRRLMNLLVIALVSLLTLTITMWWLVTRTMRGPSQGSARIFVSDGSSLAVEDQETTRYVK